MLGELTAALERMLSRPRPAPPPVVTPNALAGRPAASSEAEATAMAEADTIQHLPGA